MKISNETKIGALTSIVIVLLILGFNFLKGKSFTGTSTHYYAVYSNIEGLANGNPVVINGTQVGSVINIDGGRSMRRIVVTLNMTKDVDIPKNSVAIITPSLLGSTALEIKLGDASTFYTKEDTLITEASAGMLSDALKKIDPVLYEVTNAVRDLDSLLNTANDLFDPASKKNIRNTLASLAASSASMETLLDAQSGALAHSLSNVDRFTSGLANNNDKISQTIGNLQTTTEHLSQLDLQTTLTSLNQTIGELKTAVAKVNTTDGTIGKLVNDNSLYNNLTATSNKINLLLDDIRIHPKRYVNISVFGKKDKSGALMIPLPDTINAPYIRK